MAEIPYCCHCTGFPIDQQSAKQTLDIYQILWHFIIIIIIIIITIITNYAVVEFVFLRMFYDFCEVKGTNYIKNRGWDFCLLE